MTKRLTGAEIRDLRIQAGLSQGQLAEGIMSVSYLSLIESGRRLPRGNAIELLTERLNELGQITSSGANRLLTVETGVRLALRLGHVEAARADLEALKSSFANIDSYPPVVSMLEGLVALQERRFEEAAALEQRALEQMTPDNPQRVSAVIAYAQASLKLGILDRATALAGEALEQLQSSGTVHDRVNELREALAALYEAKGELAAAQQAATLNSAEEASAFPRGRAAILWAESRQALAAADSAHAADLANQAAALLRAVDQPVVAARLKQTSARLAVRLGRPVAEILAQLDSANHLLDTSAHQLERSELSALRVAVEARAGAADLATFELALAALAELPVTAAELRLDLAESLLATGNLELAAHQLDSAEHLLRASGEGVSALWHRLGLGFEQVGRLEQAFAAMKLATARLGSASAVERVETP